MKAINIWMLSTVLFSGLMSCEMKEEIFGKEIPKETGYLTLDVSAGSSASLLKTMSRLLNLKKKMRMV